MKTVGLLVIINSLVLTTSWLCTDHPHKGWAVTACLIAVFVGVVLVLQDRAIEITVESVGTIKAAAEQATVDAQTVADLKQRVEAQSATVDLVAESAAKAHTLIENLSDKNKTAEAKIKEIETAGTAIQKMIIELQETAKFFSTVVAAQNDDRHAFNTLAAWVDNKSYRYWQLAADAVVQIRTEFSNPIEPGFINVPWPQGIDPEQLPLERLRDAYQSSARLYKTNLVHTVWKSKVISKKAKMAFFVEILKEDDSLDATFYAGKFFVNAAGDPNLKWSPFSTKALLDWWQRNSIKVEE